MSANPIQTPQPGYSQNDFVVSGHPGKWFRSVNVGESSDVYFTGSNYGAGGVIINNATGVYLHLSNGGIISGSLLNTKEIYELGVSRVETGSGGDVYVLIRNQFVR